MWSHLVVFSNPCLPSALSSQLCLYFVDLECCVCVWDFCVWNLDSFQNWNSGLYMTAASLSYSVDEIHSGWKVGRCRCQRAVLHIIRVHSLCYPSAGDQRISPHWIHWAEAICTRFVNNVFKYKHIWIVGVNITFYLQRAPAWMILPRLSFSTRTTRWFRLRFNRCSRFCTTRGTLSTPSSRSIDLGHFSEDCRRQIERSTCAKQESRWRMATAWQCSFRKSDVISSREIKFL